MRSNGKAWLLTTTLVILSPFLFPPKKRGKKIRRMNPAMIKMILIGHCFHKRILKLQANETILPLVAYCFQLLNGFLCPQNCSMHYLVFYKLTAFILSNNTKRNGIVYSSLLRSSYLRWFISPSLGE